MGRPALAFVSEKEFLDLPETLDKVELIDGEVVVSPSPSFYHREVVRRLLVELSAWARERPEPVTVGQAPMDIRFAPGRILQPDLFVILSQIPLGHKGPLLRVPELCIEVLSARPSYDRFTKRVIYADAGVRELWTVEIGSAVERWTGDGLRRVEKVDSGVLGGTLLEDFTLDLASLFES
jgi:Uma2 family endonuclease